MPSQSDDQSSAPSANEILLSVLAEVGDLSKLLEIFYLTREPGALDLLRLVASLSDQTRPKVIEFIAATAAAKRDIQLRRTAEGSLLLEAAPTDHFP